MVGHEDTDVPNEMIVESLRDILLFETRMRPTPLDNSEMDSRYEDMELSTLIALP